MALMSATVHALVSDPVRLTSVLVTGADRALLIDTGSGPDQAARILAAVRGLTALPLTVANTHDHWDHFFGNPTFAEAGVTDFAASAAFVRDSPGSAWLQHAEASEHVLDLPSPDGLTVEARAVADGETLDLGALPSRGAGEPHSGADGAHLVEFLPLSGHTDTDLALRAGPVVVCGDLIEEGAPPQVGLDATPLAWVRSLDRLLALPGVDVFVPGHGTAVTRGFVEAQREDLLRAADSDDLDELPSRSAGTAAAHAAPASDPPYGVRIVRLL